MSKNELVEFSQMPSLEIAQSQLCSILQSGGSCLVGQLNQSQQNLVSHLDQHVELQSKPKETESWMLYDCFRCNYVMD